MCSSRHLSHLDHGANDSDSDDSALSEDIIVFETEEDLNRVDKVYVGKLARLANRTTLWDNKFSQFLTIMAFLTSYDALANFAHNMALFGAPFAFTYIFMMVFVGFPLLYMEMALGQFTASNSLNLFNRMAAASMGLGIASMVFNFVMMINDHFVVSFFSVLLYHASDFFGHQPPWYSCEGPTAKDTCRELLHSCQEFIKNYGSHSDEMVRRLGLQYFTMGTFCYRSRMLLGDRSEVEYNVVTAEKVPLSKWFQSESLGHLMFPHIRFGNDAIVFTSWPSKEFMIASFTTLVIVYVACQHIKGFVNLISRMTCVVTISTLATFFVIFYFVQVPEFPYIFAIEVTITAMLDSPEKVVEMILAALFLTLRTLKLGQGVMFYLGSQNHFKNSLVRDCIIITVFVVFLQMMYSGSHMLTVDSYDMTLVAGNRERLAHIQSLKAVGGDYTYIFATGHYLMELVLFAQSIRVYKQAEPACVFLLALMGFLATIGNQILRAEVIVSNIAGYFPFFGDVEARKVLLNLTFCLSSILLFVLAGEAGFETMFSFEEMIVPMLGCCLVLFQLAVVCGLYGPKRLLANIVAMNKRRSSQESRMVHTVINAAVICIWCFFIPIVLLFGIIARPLLGFKSRTAQGLLDMPVVFVCAVLWIIPVVAASKLINQNVTNGNFKPVLSPDRDLWGPRSSENRQHAQRIERMLRASH